MRLFFLAVLILLSPFVLLQFFGINVIFPQEKVGNISVESLPKNMPVFIDGETVGMTPLYDYEVTIGRKVVRIGSSWEAEVFVDQGSKSYVYREFLADELFSYGYLVSYEPIQGFFSNDRQVMIGSVPPGVSVSNLSQFSTEESEIGQTPLLINQPEVQNYKINIAFAGYQTKEVEYNVYTKKITRVNIDLKPDLFSSIKKSDPSILGQSSLDSQSTHVEKEITRRLDWYGDYKGFDKDEVTIGQWKKIAPWEVTLSKKTPLSGYIHELNLLSQEEGYNTLPFAYIIDSDGEIYEGVGIFDLDYSQLSSRYESGEIPVLIITSSEGVYPANLLESLFFLKDQLSEGPALTAEVITQVNGLEMSFGEARTIDFRYRNTSPVIWDKSVDEFILVSTSPRQSDLYNPEAWISLTELSRIKEQSVWPGDIGTVEVSLRVPYYPMQITETFGLKDQSTGKIIEGTIIEVKANVTGDYLGIVEVSPTQTGFSQVRLEANANSGLETVLYTGDKMPYIKEENGWLQIIMSDGNLGWVNSDTVQTIEYNE